MKKFTSEVRTDDEFADIPEQASFEIGEKTATRIRKLAEIVKENGIYIAVEFDYRVDYGVRTECDCLNVSESQFWFSARLKHTSVEIFTEVFEIDELST